MRWLVEVTSLGTSDKQALHVDAESWQSALQVARERRGESAAISGFTIDVVAEGCKAVDPISRTSYEVRKTADGSIPAPAEVPRPRAPSVPPRPQTSEVPRPLAQAQPPTASKIIFKREQERTKGLPLTYREYVYLAPAGTTEDVAEALLRTQLDRVRTSLTNVPAGKLVSLAVFDQKFEGKPTVPPIAALEWKDWRGAEVVSFPRRPPGPPPPQADPAPAPPAANASAEATLQPGAAPVQATAQRDPFAPVQPSPTSVDPIPAGSGRKPSSPRSRPDGARVRGEDLIADLFEAMHDLHFLRDSLEGGDFCLTQALERIPSEAGLVHLYDINSREFVVTSVRGASTSGLLLMRHPESETTLSKAMRRRAPVVIPGPTEPELPTAERYGAIGGARGVVVVPVMQAGRFLGAIELCNPLDGQPYTESEGHALMYIGDQLAEFVATRGIVTDPERVGARRAP